MRLRDRFGLFCALFVMASALLAQSLPPELVQGRDWLSAQVGGDGVVIGEPTAMATSLQTRAEVLDTLHRLNVTPNALATQIAQQASDSAVEHLARQIIAQAATSVVPASRISQLKSYQNANGGFGGSSKFGSDVLDTSFALVALRAVGESSGEHLARAVTYLAARATDLDNAGLSLDEGSRAYVAAYVLLGLQSYATQYPIAQPIDAARSYLLAQQGQGVYIETLLNAVSATALGFSSTSGTGLDALQAALRASQLPNGSWANDPYLTALALRGLMGNISIPPPQTGRITATVREAQILAPISGAAVNLTGISSTSSSTAGDGRVVLADIVPGSYSLRVEKSGFVPADVTGLSVVAGQTVDLGYIDLLRDNNTAVLRGRITDVRDGSPLAGASIAVQGAATAEVFSGPDGRFEWVTTSAGPISILVTRTGFQSATATATLVLGQVLELSPALYPDGLQPPTSAILIGTVVSAEGDAPIGGATIQIGSVQALTGADGGFQLIDLPVGSLVANIGANGFVPTLLTGTLAAGVNNAGVIRLAPDHPAATSSVSGRITDSDAGTPIVGALVEFAGGGLRASSGVDGRYQLTGISTVPFTLTVSAAGYQSQTASVGSQTHGSFVADMALTKLTGGNVALESVVMAAPDYDPFSEVAVVGTVRNLGSSEAGLVFNAIVFDANQQIVRDVPAVKLVFNSNPGDNILTIAAGATRTINILWGNLDDVPGDYSVLFRGVNPNGQVAVEGSTGYRVRALKRLGGTVLADPPLLQAGIGQSVKLTARLGNLGNLPIAAGTAELKVTLARADNRPPAPPAPVIGDEILRGTPLNRPLGSAIDGAGNVYTVNVNTRELVRIAPDGQGTVLRVLSILSGPNGIGGGSMGQVSDLAMHADGALRVAWSSGWISRVDLSDPYLQNSTLGPVSALVAYTADSAGNEIFAGTYQGRLKIVKRAQGGLVSVLADAGFGSPAGVTTGIDGHFYVTNSSNGAVYKIDSSTGVVSVHATGLLTPYGIAAQPDGSFLVAEASGSGNIRRVAPDGSLSVHVAGLGGGSNMLRTGNDGKLYWFNPTLGEIRRIEADGTHTRFASGLVSSVSALGLDLDQQLIAASRSELRRLKADLTQETIASGFSLVRGVVETARDSFLVLDNNIIKRVDAGISTPLTTIAGDQPYSITADESGQVYVDTVGRENKILALGGGTLNPVHRLPRTIRGIVRGSTSPVLWTQTGLYSVNAQSQVQPIGPEFVNLTFVVNDAAGEIYAYEAGIGTPGLFRIQSTGQADRIIDAPVGTVTGIAIDSLGRVLFGRTRTIDRFDPATGQSELLYTIVGTSYIAQLMVDGTDTIFWRTNTSEIWRLDGAVGTRLAQSVSALNLGSDGRVWFRRTNKLYRLDDAGQEELRYTLLASPTDVTLQSGDLPVAWRATPLAVDFIDAAGSVSSQTLLPDQMDQMVVWGGTFYVRDSRSRLTRIAADGSLTRIGGDTPGIVTIDGDATGIYVARGDGIYRVTANLDFEAYWSNPSWRLNDYRLFDVRGGRLAIANSATSEVELRQEGQLVTSLAPIQSAFGFAQRVDGSWIAVTGAAFVEITQDGSRSRVLTRNDVSGRDIARTANGEMHVVSDLDSRLLRLEPNGEIEILAAATHAYVPLRLIGTSGDSTYVFTSSGTVVKRNNAFLEPFTAGMSSVSDLALDSTGRVYVADSLSASVSVIDELGYRQLAFGFGAVTAISVLSDNAILASTNASLVLVNAAGGWSQTRWSPGVNNPSLQRLDANHAVVFDYSAGRMISVSIADPLPVIAPGTVVFQAQRSYPDLALSGQQALDFGAWLPAVGGDYEMTVRSTDPEVSGQATSGIHIGPNASASVYAEPARVSPGSRQVRVGVHVEGGDFSSLSRVDASQLQLLLPNAIYPPAMGMDASGALWYVNNSLYRSQGGQAGVRMGTLTGYSQRGEVPVDSQQRAYATRRVSISGGGYSEIRRVDDVGDSVVLATIPEVVQSLTIDAGDNIYAVVAGKVYRISPDGIVSDYAALPAGTPYGITRDGAGNIYVQMVGSLVYRIDPLKNLTTVLSDAAFENEGVNIAGACAEGLFFTPSSYLRVGQNGEEYTVAQVLGSTGEIGPILNGRVISDDLLDMDFLGYDRFGSRLLVMSEANGYKLFSLPVTCGAIDVDMHMVLAPEQSLDLIDPPATQTIHHDDGRVEIIWSLRDVNRQGVDLSYLTGLSNLDRGESRPVAREGWLEFRNTFTSDTVRVPVQVPSVTVDDLIEISAATDLPSYSQHTNIDIDVFLRNLEDQGKTGRLWIRVEDAQGALVETLIDRADVFGPLEERELDPPFNSGSNRAGGYRLVAEVRDEFDRVMAQASAEFAITIGDGSPSLTATVRTDAAEYRPQEQVTIFAEARNLSANQGFANLTLSEIVRAPDDSEFASFQAPIANLEPDALARAQFTLPLGAAAAGSYRVEQRVLDSSGTVLSSVATDFQVLPEQGNQALSGSLTIDPAVIAGGQIAAITAQIGNRGNTVLSAVPLRIQILDPGNSNAVLVEWVSQQDIEAGAAVQWPQQWNTSGVALGDYIVTLLGSIGGQSVVLDQKPLRVASTRLSGTLSASPVDALPADTITLSAQVSNTGNLAGVAIPFRLEIARADSGAQVREWNYVSDLGAGQSLTRVETPTAASLGIGDYRVRWSAQVGGQSQTLAETLFSVRGIQISGSIDATPSVMEINAPVQLAAQVRNLGNLEATDLPVRIEVRRRDTQALMDSWNETATIAAGGTHLLSRQWQTSTASDYQAVAMAQIAGAWSNLATADFTVTAPAVDVDLQIGLQRDARLLVLVSCAPGQDSGAQSPEKSAIDGGSDTGRSQEPTSCELGRKAFLDQYLSQLAIDHKVVTTDEEFMTELRCGHYNTYWLSGGSEKLAVADAKELRETIYRGDGLLLDGSHDQRTSFIDEMAGYLFRGHLPQPDLSVRGAGTLLPLADVSSYGTALHIEPSTGQVEASFIATSTAAVISNVFGQGHALIYAFDLVKVLQRDSTLPASARLFDNGLVFAAPTVSVADFATGAYVPVTTTVENRAQAVDLRLRSSVSAPATVAGAAPVPTGNDPQSASWDFNLAASQRRSFDLDVRMPDSAASGIDALSELSRRAGSLLEPLSNVTQALPVRDAAATSAQLLAEMNSANLTGGERAARDRAVRAIGDAMQTQAGADPYAAIGHWIDAAEEIVRITSVPTANWRLANARLLEISQHSSCGIAPPGNSCDVLGVAGQYNGFFFENYTAGSSDVQGRLAAGGNISLNNYSIGDQLPTSFAGASLLAGGNLQFPSGRVYVGDIVVGGSAAGVGAPVINGLGPNQHLLQNAVLPVDFAAERVRLTAESQRLATLTANATWENQWGGLYLHGDNHSALQVFNLPGTEVLNAHTFAVDGVPAGATVLFNISGASAGLTNMSMSSLIPNRNQVLFNFHQATTLQLAGISVEGSVLAPLADINNPQGVVWGSVVAKSWNGMMQINLAQYAGCTAAGSGTPPPSLCTTQPAAPVLLGTGDGVFSAFEARERLEVRGGRKGAADWEWGLGVNTQSAGQFVQSNLDWVSGKNYRFVLNYDGIGNGRMQVFDGATSLFVRDFTANGAAGLRAGDALDLHVQSSTGTGNSKITVNATQLNGKALSESIATIGNGNVSEARLTYFYPVMRSGLQLEGSVRMDFPGNAPPTGSRLSFTVNAGNLSCAGGAP
jgi:choice-of-anchor A domain-containing protein